VVRLVDKTRHRYRNRPATTTLAVLAETVTSSNSLSDAAVAVQVDAIQRDNDTAADLGTVPYSTSV